MKCPSCPQEFWTADSFESHWEGYHEPTEGALLAECLGCPRCGERRMSQFELLEPYREEAECQTCGKVYRP